MKVGMAGLRPLRQPANLPSLVSRPTVVDTPTFLSVTFDGKEDKDLKVAGPNPPLLVSKATLVSRPTIVDTPTFLSITFDRKEDKDLKVAGHTAHTALIAYAAHTAQTAHKDVKEGDSDVFNNMWTQLESAARCPSLRKTSLYDDGVQSSLCS